MECLLPRCYVLWFFHSKRDLKNDRAEHLLQLTVDVTYNSRSRRHMSENKAELINHNGKRYIYTMSFKQKSSKKSKYVHVTVATSKQT